MAAIEIDARGSFCPGPLMEMMRAVKTASVGDTVSVLSSDFGSKKDIPLWAAKAGQKFVGVVEQSGYEAITVEKIK